METGELTGVVGVGTDLVEVDRILRVLDRRPGLTSRLFTESERAYCDSARTPHGRARRYAARFSAKEAAMKALGVGLGGVAFTEIETTRSASGAVALRVHGRAAELAGDAGGSRWLVSLTHTDRLAQAVVLLASDPLAAPNQRDG